MSAAVVLAAAALAFAARVGGALPTVLPEGEPALLLGTDAYEHVRRAGVVLGSLEAAGAPVPAAKGERLGPGLWDRALALPVRVLAGPSPSPERIARVAAWTPPLLGAAGVALVWALGLGLGGRGLALWATALALLYPGEWLSRSVLGFADHHAAEVVLALAALWGLMAWLRRPAGLPPLSWAYLLVCALPTTLLLASTRIGPAAAAAVLVGPIAVVPIGVLLGRPVDALLRRAAVFGAAVAALLVLVHLVLPGLEAEPWAMRRAGWCSAVLACWPLLLWPVSVLQRRRVARGLLVTVSLALGILGVAALSCLPVSRELLLLTRARTPTVAEHVPVTLDLAVSTLGALLPLAPIGTVLLLARSRTARGGPAGVLAIGAAVVWSAAWFLTRDLGYLPPPFLALVAAPAPWMAQRWLRAGLRGRWAPLLAALPPALLIVAPIWPYALTARPWVDEDLAAALQVYDRADVEAVLWLRETSPAPAAAEGTFTVASPWVLGNLVGGYGERRAVWGRFPTREASRWLLASTDGRSIRVLERATPEALPARYAVLDARSCGAWFQAEALTAGVPLEPAVTGYRRLDATGWPIVEPGRTYRHSLAVRLCRGSGSGRYRLVWQSAERRLNAFRLERSSERGDQTTFGLRLDTLSAPPPGLLSTGEATPTPRTLLYEPQWSPAAAVFEIVRGARIRGNARAGAAVRATLPLDLGNGRRMLYRRVVRSRPDGTFELLVSQPTTVEAHRSAVRPLGHYALAIDGVPLGEVEIAPDQVRTGAVVTLPPPASSAAAAPGPSPDRGRDRGPAGR